MHKGMTLRSRHASDDAHIPLPAELENNVPDAETYRFLKGFTQEMTNGLNYNLYPKNEAMSWKLFHFTTLYPALVVFCFRRSDGSIIDADCVIRLRQPPKTLRVALFKFASEMLSQKSSSDSQE